MISTTLQTLNRQDSVNKPVMSDADKELFEKKRAYALRAHEVACLVEKRMAVQRQEFVDHLDKMQQTYEKVYGEYERAFEEYTVLCDSIVSRFGIDAIPKCSCCHEPVPQTECYELHQDGKIAIGDVGAGNSNGDGPIRCFNCGKAGHDYGQCVKKADPKAIARNTAAFAALQKSAAKNVALPQFKRAPPVRPAVARVVRPILPPRAQVSKVIKRDGMAIEHKIEERFGKPGTVLHEGSKSQSGRHQHGRVVYGGTRQTKHGTAHVFHYTTRVDAITLTGTTAAGTILVRLRIHPSTLGPTAQLQMTPYTKYLVRMLKSHYDSEIAMVDPQARGAMYMAYNSNPNVVIPFGELGPKIVSNWGPNVEPCPLKRADDVTLHCHLNLEAQVPLFVGRTPDDQWDTQGVFFLMASVPLNAGGSALQLGELYIDSEVEVYQLAIDESDYSSEFVACYNPSAANGTTALQNWPIYCGSKEMIYFLNPATAGASFVCVEGGSILIEVSGFQNVAGNPLHSTTGGLGSLTYLPQTGQAPPTPLGTTPFGSVFTNVAGGIDIASFDRIDAVPLGATEANYNAFNDDVGTLANVGASKRQVRALYAFTCAENSLFVIQMPYTDYADTFTLLVRFSKISKSTDDLPLENRNIPNIASNTGDALMALRPDHEFNLRKALACVDQYEPNDSDLMIIMTVLSREGAKSPGESNYIIDKLQLPLPKFSVTTAFLPVVAAVASWAVATFGPMLADKALKWVQDKIDGGSRVVEKPRRDRKRRDPNTE